MERNPIRRLRRAVLTGLGVALMLPGAAHAAPGVPDPAPTSPQGSQVLPGGPPRAGARTAAAWSSWWLKSAPVTFTKNGVSYRLVLWASEYEQAGVDNDVYLSFDVRRTNDPAGVKKSTQHHSWSFSGVTDRFTHRATLSRAALSSDDDLAPYGTVDIRFRQNAALKEKCGGGFLTRRGSLSGLLELKTGPSALGKITELPATATLHRYTSSASCGGGGSGPEPCPSPARGVYGSRGGGDDLYLSAWKRDGAAVAHVYAARGGALSPADPAVSGWLWHSIVARMASSRLEIATDLSTATVRGATGTWLSGTASFAPAGALSESGATGCGSAGTKEYLYKTREGTMTGTFTADFLVGPDRTVGATGLDADGYRLVVRAI